MKTTNGTPLSFNESSLWHPAGYLQNDLAERFGFYRHSEALPSVLAAHPGQRVFRADRLSPRRLFRRLSTMLGLAFLPSVYENLAGTTTAASPSASYFHTKKPLDVIDLQDVRPVVKQMAIASEARGMLHHARALLQHTAARVLIILVRAVQLSSLSGARVIAGDV